MTLPAPPSVMARFADIPEEEIRLAKQKGPRTCRACRIGVRHFMATLGITGGDELKWSFYLSQQKKPSSRTQTSPRLLWAS